MKTLCRVLALFGVRRVFRFAIAALVTTMCAVPMAARWDADRRLTRNSTDSISSINFARSVASDERGRVHVVWIDHRDGSPKVYTKRSIDAGLSWGPPIRLTGGDGNSFNPSVAAVGDFVHVVWQESGNQPIHYRRSADGGVSWETVRTINILPSGSPSVAALGRGVHVVYGRPDGGQGSDIFYARSLDDGETWLDEERISNLPYSSWTPTIAAAAGHVYIAWTDTFHSGMQCCLEEEYFAVSDDEGGSWSEPFRLTVDPSGALANSWAPSLAASDSNVWIVWFDERSGDWEIYTKMSQDYGHSWSEDRRLTFSQTSALRPSIAQRGSELFVTYWQALSGESEEIFLLHSSDRGATWDPPQRLTTAPGPSILPSVSAGEHGVHMVWTDGRDGNAEMYYKRLPGAPVEVGNGLIAFSRAVAGSQQIFTVAADGSDERQLTFEGENLAPAWSRDGSRLLFTSTRGGGAALWAVEPDGSNPTPLTSGGQLDFTGDWAYDGTRIAFASVRGGVPRPEIWIQGIDGSSPMALTTGPDGTGGSVHPSFAPGDAAIYYGSNDSGTTQVWGMIPTGQGKEQKTNGLASDSPEANVPEWSRQNVLVFWSGIEGQYGEIWSWDPSSGVGPNKLTETADPFNSDNPSWSPDGSSILFDSNRGGAGVDVWVMDADGSKLRLLIPGAGGQTAWQPVNAATAGVALAPPIPALRPIRNAVPHPAR